jgi:hypothetical protein
MLQEKPSALKREHPALQKIILKRTSMLQEKPSALKREHPALQKIILFSMFVGHFCPPGSGYGSSFPIESRYNPIPDPIRIHNTV